MATFTVVLEKLKDIFTTDPDITAFFQARYQKVLTARLGFHKRVEISLTMHPFLFITQPSFAPVEKYNRTATRLYHVNTFWLISQQDRARAVEELIELESLVDAAIRKDPTLGGLVREAWAAEGVANDEGIFHPNYAFVMPLTVLARKELPGPESDEGMLEGVDIKVGPAPVGDGTPYVEGSVEFPQT